MYGDNLSHDAFLEVNIFHQISQCLNESNDPDLSVSYLIIEYKDDSINLKLCLEYTKNYSTFTEGFDVSLSYKYLRSIKKSFETNKSYAGIFSKNLNACIMHHIESLKDQAEKYFEVK